MIESRAGWDQLDEGTRAAINGLPEAARAALFAWIQEARRGEAGWTAGIEGEWERERTRVARELHDSIGGDLAASVALFKYYFENPAARGGKDEVLTNIYEVLQTTLQNVRAMLRSLRSR